MTDEEFFARVNQHGQVTVPDPIRREAHLEAGDILTVHVEGEKIVLTPKKRMEKSQAYFWSESWQQAERDADRDIAEGCVETFETVEDWIDALDHDGA